jgi:hypothetical protein
MLLIAAILSSPFTAMGEEVTEQARQESKKHFQQGDAYLQAGAYKSAAEEFLEAYRLWPNERFHYSIAQAYRLGGEKEKAVEHYKLYLAAFSEGDTANDARQQLARLMTDIEREQAARAAEEKAAAEAKAAADAKAAAEANAAAEAKTAAEAKAAADAKAQEDAKAAEAAKNASAQPIEPKTPQETSPRARKPRYWIAGVVAGVVVVGVAVGLGVGLSVHNDAPIPQTTLGNMMVKF